MNNKFTLATLFLVYFIFAILLNSTGTVILQVINTYDIGKTEASMLELMKDISIAAVTFFAASLLPRIGYKNALVISMVIVALGCCLMPLLPSFLTTKFLFFLLGVSFALAKISVYSSVGLLTQSKHEHTSTLNLLEGFFMIGVLSGSWLFASFIDSTNPKSPSWLNVYWMLAVMAACIALLMRYAKLDSSQLHGEQQHNYAKNLGGMLRLLLRPLVCVYVLSAFVFVLIEQSIGTWLPTFNNEILKLPLAMSVQVASIFAASCAIGRLCASVITRRVSWYPVVNICILSVAFLIVLTLPLTDNITVKANINWFNAPIAAYIFPLLGFFLAPIYPCINSVMLTSLPKYQHAAMTGLLVIFSALGGTTGSMLTGYIFGKFSGQTAFYLTLAPILMILFSLYFFKRSVDKVESMLNPEEVPKAVAKEKKQELASPSFGTTEP